MCVILLNTTRPSCELRLPPTFSQQVSPTDTTLPCTLYTISVADDLAHVNKKSFQKSAQRLKCGLAAPFLMPRSGSTLPPLAFKRIIESFMASPLCATTFRGGDLACRRWDLTSYGLFWSRKKAVRGRTTYEGCGRPSAQGERPRSPDEVSFAHENQSHTPPFWPGSTLGTRLDMWV